MRTLLLAAAVMFLTSPHADAANPLVGSGIGPMQGVRWLTSDGAWRWGDRKLTLLRWWTTSCPHCSASVPALSDLAKRYRAKGLAFVAVYHRKGRRQWSDAELRTYLQRLGFEGTLARDDRWTKLQELMRRGRLRRATSISLLVDARGIVRWVHPGPRIHASNDPRYRQADADLKALDRFLAAWFAPKPAPPPTPPAPPK